MIYDAGHPNRHRRAAFTIAEILTVVALMMILMAMLLPVFSRTREEARKVLCSSQMRQWTVGLGAYGNDNDAYFPDNRDLSENPALAIPGQHVSWNSSVVNQFFAQYLLPFGPASKTLENDVLFCPTQRWHEINDVTTAGGLVGYFYLPHRTPTNINYTWAENGRGREWVAKDRLGGLRADTPILIDMLQQHKTLNWWWSDNITPFSSHIEPDGRPEGGNFLYEDGHVAWFAREAVGLGADMGGWWFYYDVPLH